MELAREGIRCSFNVWASGRPFWRVREFSRVRGARFHAAVFLDGPFLSPLSSLPLFPLISIADGADADAPAVSSVALLCSAWLLDLLHLATQRLCPSLPLPSLPSRAVRSHPSVFPLSVRPRPSVSGAPLSILSRCRSGDKNQALYSL